MTSNIYSKGGTNLYAYRDRFLVGDERGVYYLARKDGDNFMIMDRMGTPICNCDFDKMLDMMKDLTARHEAFVNSQIKEYGDVNRLCPKCGVVPRECFCTLKEAD